jgi:hypothetical protein
MLKHICIILFILSLIFTNNYAQCVTSSRGEYVANQYDDIKSQRIRPSTHTDINVINIIIDKVENGTIYSKDGQAFAITDSTQIINNHISESNMKIGELFFKNGKLITIVIK